MTSTTTSLDTLPPLAGLIRSNASVNLYAIQGEPGTGKTKFVTGIDKLITLDYDKKLPNNIPSIPFYSDNWINTWNKVNTKTGLPIYPDRVTAIKTWLRQEGPKIPADYFLFIDSYTMIDNDWNQYVTKNKHLFMTKGGKDNPPEFNLRAAFEAKLLFNIELFGLLKSLDCSVIVSFHEQPERDAQGRATGKFRPIVNGGSFKDQVLSHFGNTFRTVHIGDKYLLQVRSNTFFTAMVSSKYAIPDGVKELDITDKPGELNGWSKLQQYRVQ